MHQRTRLILTATATFFAGLLTGATVFPDVLRHNPPPEPVTAEQAAPSPGSQPAPEAPASVATVTTVEPEPPPAEPEPPVAAPPSVSPEVTDALKARVDELTAGWGRMQSELAALRQRVATIERRKPEAEDDADGAAQRNRPSTPAQQRESLVSVGVAPEVADDIIWRESQLSLARLELRDEAARNGWLGSARYRDELRRLNGQRVSIEDEIGVDAYDRYLYQTGQSNRVAVESVLPGSAGEESGLLPGDVIERYGDQPVLDFQDLRAATSAGERGELVNVTVVRDGERVELVLPRGPIGIGLDATRLDPSG
ncbi:MAG: PDZ domain-containing protein [Thiohalocapsa sp.]|jgi:hypothetical protein|uniref:PDZ domain-containing protein n=1 Tax=Thiohalocapsa sp. TaxID=2497641 RepID=UPI0025DC34EF|nr:PDZ domain-containing protein [Thiohalocapsa sp.]MCG6941912.1 PDZ domain-containing protein [Thiohalocapsa sp.]